ncbi:glutamate synthase large subunit [Thalassospira sp. GO-4]|jgi:glutamate synthase (NADPH/NADH) large chain|uniref:glutamate synthase large subunit n=1 Tax=unclassified Thalassospira TaxID=2648997 RepID=UPI001B270F69|nr:MULTISPECIES: glutamate synthase large subunit [unclassified Thalassospira]MBO6769976.1 glutamate synthase large subunit [Thalassospira sp.]URK17112.1 glutamate synthase large subunit [Thalassospira sp. GO-4]
MNKIVQDKLDQGRGAAEIARFEKNAAHLEASGMYDPAEEHANCGVGLVGAIDGKPRREVVEAGIEALKAIWHRGAVDADGKTGDGAGIHLQIPQDFFKAYLKVINQEAPESLIAVGQVFLPRIDMSAQERCRAIVETEILKQGYGILGWRQVPVDVSVIGEKANQTRPEIEQVLIGVRDDVDEEKFEIDLYAIRRRIEKAVLSEAIKDFYICSMSCRSIIYKGMFLAEDVDTFYPDLRDERFISSFCVYHQRYSTNTFPSWPLAQPFRVLAHNGEINTLRGNVNWMKSHEARMAHEVFADSIDDLKPVIQPGSSDSAALDAVFELMIRAGRDLPMVKTMMVPEAWSKKASTPDSYKNLYAYCNAVMEPWDGPAALAAYGGKWLLGGTDRNGLRPLRYAVTGNGLLIAGSEAGMVHIDEESCIEKGRLGPGQMIAVNLEEGKLYHDRELKDKLANRRDWSKWVGRTKVLDDLISPEHTEPSHIEKERLLRLQKAMGLTHEDLELILHPMGEDGKEAIGSMGDDTPLAILSDRYRGLHHFFRQNFSQVTNPPIDSLREARVMSLKTRLGNLGNVLDEDESQCDLLQLESPVLTNAEYDAMRGYMGDTAVEIDTTFDINGGQSALRDAISRIQREAEEAVRGGALHIILTDEAISEERAAIPMILATGGVHSHLVKTSLRTYISLNVRSAECMDVHYFAVLIGVGATTVNAYLAQEGLLDRYARGLFPNVNSTAEVMQRFKAAIDAGLLKIMSKMGISIISSYRGGYNFESIGLSRSLVAEFFPGMPSRISGIGLQGIQRRTIAQHKEAFNGNVVSLPVGGLYKYRRSGERHVWTGPLIHTLQSSVTTGSYNTFRKFSEGLRSREPLHLRDLLDFRSDRSPVHQDKVESITEIRKRFVTPGMSHGALSTEAHEALAIAMNRIGAKSNSGEGGESRERFRPRANGDNARSSIKQVASGRFGVTAEYLNNCEEIQIKVAQGAKPGEGGQLPGFKVTVEIAQLRHATPGVTLISPPPHHDIYSIEDLAQLIYDLKQINPRCRVCVKLVSRSGVGTIAAGVAKAKADVILISGYDGGTGASPQTSIKYAGVPWEMGLSEVNQVLTLNNLRDKVKLRVDGGFKTGRDVVIGAMLGAEEFGIGTASLIALGCIMVRQCHSNTCPVGVCTQDPALRAKFVGTADKLVNLFTFMAEEVKDVLAELGYDKLEDVIGRSDLLQQVHRGAKDLVDLDLNPLLAQADAGDHARFCTIEGRNEVPDTLDAQMIKDARPLLEDGEKMQLQYNIQNTQRAIGTRMSSLITQKYGMTGLKPGHLHVRLRGSAGQSLGAFAVQGLKIEVQGDANDYVGKGLSGGTIVLRPRPSSPLKTNENTIIGNTILYGATSGKLFAAGQAGERFCVRNSGATVVVEGCGSNGCEYMTGGTAVILGSVGENFGAGMTGGMAFIYDVEGTFADVVNDGSILYQRIETQYWDEHCRSLIEEHVAETESGYARTILDNWDRERGNFWQIVPKEIVDKLEHPIRSESENQATA